MSPVVVRSRVGKNGVLELKLPLGPGEADRDVQVTVEAVSSLTPTASAWQAFLDETAGKWQGELERPHQGEYEQRDSWK